MTIDSATPPPIPHCEKCGAQMILEDKQQIVYDRVTGAKAVIHHWHAKCPRLMDRIAGYRYEFVNGRWEFFAVDLDM